ncbi:MAG: LacI family DNA-binding transcriptional regulator [Devosia sp.]|uniref:LacI family DNA-binding transcriptional regulator n=1 Tax=Devosia sp. TaxID=1871048 RepID=UPI001AD21D2D|nr:LacI family DNA-binding transcriptional regulator [Devosia sp.]MBN9315294.1 LacI family DNA-binding transcriptional regulator [Devosia sp.]
MTKRLSITLKDVAAEAGVSVGIASRVLGGYGSFSEKSRASVMAAAKKLNYRANGVARSLRLRRTNTIGVLISQISSYHWTTFVQGVEEAAKRAGYGVILSNTGDDPAREMDCLRDMRERGIDGIIASPLDRNVRAFRQAVDSGFPIVTVNVDVGSERAAVVATDERRAGADAVAYLSGLGHRRIGLVAGDLELESGRLRLESYRVGLAEAGLESDETLVVYGNYRRDEAYAAARRLISLTEPPTAILVCNESMTGAVLECLRDHDVRIPGDISLVGFDDPDWARFYSPAITTLREERYYMGKLACDALVSKLERSGHSPDAAQLTLRTRLVVRQSCAAPRAAPSPVHGLVGRTVAPADPRSHLTD